MSVRARFLWVFIIALAVAALSATLALAMPQLGKVSWDIFGTALTFAGCFFGVMLCAIVIERRRVQTLMFVSIAGFAINCLLGWLMIWFPFMPLDMWEAQDLVGKLILSFSLVPSVCAVIGLLRIINPSTNLVRITRTVTETVSVAFTIVSLLMLWEIVDNWLYGPSEFVVRIWGGLLILSIAGALGTPALRAIEIARRKDAAESGLPVRIDIAITCPRCERQQTIPTGGASCAGCGLSIKVEIEEPQCPSCGYSLANLDSDTCPECGAEIG